ncbi:C-C motif chemokine 27a [Centroberyx gerrardi]|uniref:C-C motif chemokine 27a n=1 Tax=Centroberyx gerrardi TaxID=166262 RepID=UPI003AB01D8A
MDPKVVVLCVCLCTLAITSIEAGIPRCCVRTSNNIPPHVLAKVERWVVQESSGACDIKALVLHVRGWRKPICAHPKLKKQLMKIRMKMKQSKQIAAY